MTTEQTPNYSTHNTPTIDHKPTPHPFFCATTPIGDPPFTPTQAAAYSIYIQLTNQRALGLTTPDDQFHEDTARCYFRAAGIPDELKTNGAFMEWWNNE